MFDLTFLLLWCPKDEIDTMLLFRTLYIRDTECRDSNITEQTEQL